MKTKFLNLCGILFLGVISASCSKTVTPQDTKIDGDLAGAFSIVDEKYPIEKDGKDATVTIKIKRTDVTVPYVADKVCALGKDADEEMMVQAGFGYTLYDADGKEMEKISADDNESYKQIAKILALAPGEEGELTLKFDSSLTPKTVGLTSKAKILSTGPLEFTGSIGKYGIKNFVAQFDFAKGSESGKYQYLTSPAGAYLYFDGKNEENKSAPDKKSWTFRMDEHADNTSWTGTFEGTIYLVRDSENEPYYYNMEGKFTNSRMSTFSFSLPSKPIVESKNAD